MGTDPSGFILPDRLKKYFTERAGAPPSATHGAYRDALFLNSCARPATWVLRRVSELEFGTAIVSDGFVVAVRMESRGDDKPPEIEDLRKGGIKMLPAQEGSLLRPWDLVESLNTKLEGHGVIRGDGVTIEQPVYFDTNPGPVLIADGAVVEAFSRIQGPAILGRNCVIHSARINGHTYIGEMCKVGGEVESSVISSFTNKAHFGYVGHSYVGEWVNIGAGAVTSDLKNTYGHVRVSTPTGSLDTGLIKLGSFICDYSKVSIGALVYAGKRVGTGSHVYGLVDEDVPSFVRYGKYQGMGTTELRLESVIETARRMQGRRGISLSAGEEYLIRRCFEETSNERGVPS